MQLLLLGPAPANTVVLYYTSFLSITCFPLGNILHFKLQAAVRVKLEPGKLMHKQNSGFIQKNSSHSISIFVKPAAKPSFSLPNHLL